MVINWAQFVLDGSIPSPSGWFDLEWPCMTSKNGKGLPFSGLPHSWKTVYQFLVRRAYGLHFVFQAARMLLAFSNWTHCEFTSRKAVFKYCSPEMKATMLQVTTYILIPYFSKVKIIMLGVITKVKGHSKVKLIYWHDFTFSYVIIKDWKISRYYSIPSPMKLKFFCFSVKE